MNPTRRKYILAAGATLASAGTAVSVGAQSDVPEITFGELDHEGEYVILHNEESSEIDIDGLWLNWEHGQNVDQYNQFSADYGVTSIPANGSIKVATGAVEQDDADVDFGRDGHVMNNDGSDTYTVETEDQETIIARSDEDRHESDTDTETETPTDTPTETETETPTDTPTDTETPTDTPTDTETPTNSEGDC